jgi:hypothetical protein
MSGSGRRSALGRGLNVGGLAAALLQEILQELLNLLKQALHAVISATWLRAGALAPANSLENLLQELLDLLEQGLNAPSLLTAASLPGSLGRASTLSGTRCAGGLAAANGLLNLLQELLYLLQQRLNAAALLAAALLRAASLAAADRLLDLLELLFDLMQHRPDTAVVAAAGALNAPGLSSIIEPAAGLRSVLAHIGELASAAANVREQLLYVVKGRSQILTDSLNVQGHGRLLSGYRFCRAAAVT